MVVGEMVRYRGGRGKMEQAAAVATAPSLGRGWSPSYSCHLAPAALVLDFKMKGLFPSC